MISHTLVVSPGLMGARAIAAEFADGFAAAPLDNLAGRKFHAIHVHDVLRNAKVQLWLKDIIDRQMEPGTFDNVFFHDSPAISN